MKLTRKVYAVQTTRKQDVQEGWLPAGTEVRGFRNDLGSFGDTPTVHFSAKDADGRWWRWRATLAQLPVE